MVPSRIRMVIDAPWYRALFPSMRPAKDSGTKLVTTLGGSRYATSIGGTLTGRGADLIIVDDPLKAEEAMSEPARKRVIEWYAGTHHPRQAARHPARAKKKRWRSRSRTSQAGGGGVTKD